MVNGQIIGKKKVVPDGNINTYFGRLGIIHQKLGVRLEVSTQDISVFHDGKQIKLLWSDTASIKESKWVTLDNNTFSTEIIEKHFVIFSHVMSKRLCLSLTKLSMVNMQNKAHKAYKHKACQKKQIKQKNTIPILQHKISQYKKNFIYLKINCPTGRI